MCGCLSAELAVSRQTLSVRGEGRMENTVRSGDCEWREMLNGEALICTYRSLHVVMNKGWLQDSLLIESNCSHLGAMAWCWKTKHMIKGHAQSAEKPQLSKICQEEESLEWICFLAPHNKLTTKGLPRSWIRNQSFPPPPSPPVPQSSPLHLPISCPSGYSYVHGEQVSKEVLYFLSSFSCSN